MHNHVLKNLIGDIVGITLPESESALTHISCYLTNVCLHLPQGGCSGSRDRNQFRFHGRLAPPKAQNNHRSIFSSFFTYKNAMCVFRFAILGATQKVMAEHQRVVDQVALGPAKCVGFNCSMLCMPKDVYKSVSSNLDCLRLL